MNAPFQPLDLDIVSAAIPAFFIGRNKDGLWVARDAKGKAGGLFLFERSALSFARRHSRPNGCATIYPSERFELDLGNTGNPLAVQLAALKRLAMRARQEIGGLFPGTAQRGIFDRAMLTHNGGPFKPARPSSRGQATAGSATANAHLAMIRRFLIGALAAAGAVAAIVALKVVLFVRVNHFY